MPINTSVFWMLSTTYNVDIALTLHFINKTSELIRNLKVKNHKYGVINNQDKNKTHHLVRIWYHTNPITIFKARGITSLNCNQKPTNFLVMIIQIISNLIPKSPSLNLTILQPKKCFMELKPQSTQKTKNKLSLLP